MEICIIVYYKRVTYTSSTETPTRLVSLFKTKQENTFVTIWHSTFLLLEQVGKLINKFCIQPSSTFMLKVI